MIFFFIFGDWLDFKGFTNPIQSPSLWFYLSWMVDRVSDLGLLWVHLRPIMKTVY